MPHANAALWVPEGISRWPQEVRHRLDVSLDAAYIELQAQLQRRLQEYFPEAEEAHCFSPEFFWEPFFDYAVSTYDAYADELCGLPLALKRLELLLAWDLPIHVSESTAAWQERGDWQHGLEEAWLQFEHPRHRSLHEHAMKIAGAFGGPISPYWHKFIETVAKRLAKRARVWQLEWKNRHPQETGGRASQELATAVEERQPMTPVMGEDLGRQRRSKADVFLAECNRHSRVKFTRTHIWKAAGHTSPRQFQYWQNGKDRIPGAKHGATHADALNFRRILSLSCSEFENILRIKQIL
jgi:hypothetical protein